MEKTIGENGRSGADDDRHRGRTRRVLLRLLWLAVGTLVAFVVAELVVTAVHGPTVRFPRRVVEAPWGLRYNEPGAHYRHRSPDVNVAFRINAQGMRADEDYAYAKPQGRRRIICLGDSFTAGYEVEQEETFARVLERELTARGHSAQVLNAGVSGYSNAEALLYLERELYRYEPDVVVLSFFSNDLADNVRTGLFDLEQGRLVPRAERYVPLGRLGNFLNTNFLFNFLSERSNLMALLKERVTMQLKSRLVAENLQATREGSDGDTFDPEAFERELAAAILERLLGWCREHGVGLVIQSIPLANHREPSLQDDFPYAGFPVDQPGLLFVRCRDFLDPLLGKDLLYWTRSHSHWTPLAHQLAGERLAEVLDQSGWLAP